MVPNSGIEIGKTATVTTWMAEAAKPAHHLEMLERQKQAA
jgi:hypothetical protein